MLRNTNNKQQQTQEDAAVQVKGAIQHEQEDNTLFGKFDKWYRYFAVEGRYDLLYICILFLMECILCYWIVLKVPYTEIDWIAYMEEVETWYINGETNYYNIRGGTGPLVYPAGFIYLFTLLRSLTNNGTNIRIAQYLFFIFYLLNQLIVWYIYQQTIQYFRYEYNNSETNNTNSKQQLSDITTQEVELKNQSQNQCQQQKVKQFCHIIWQIRIAMGMICLSKRIHSIFLLRLFNDGPTMVLLYLSIVFFNTNSWDIGCVIFSLAVSIKMNVLLFAPGLLLLLLQASTNYTTVLRRLVLCCAGPQIILGLPFLLTYPIPYIRKAFELDRVFFYKWTVNWKFIPEHIFISKQLSLLLLSLHISFLLYYFCYVWRQSCTSTKNEQQQQKQSQSSTEPNRFLFLLNSNNNNNSNKNTNIVLSAPYVTTTMFTSNYIGIVFARTLHYQFYSWYFHSIPYLLWISLIITIMNNDYTTTTTTINNNNNNNNSLLQYIGTIVYRFTLFGCIEVAFLTFPATPTSSFVLQVVHFIILFYHIRPFPNAIIITTTTTTIPALPKSSSKKLK